MKKNKVIIILISIIAVSVFVSFLAVSRHPAEEKGLYYCPMHPTYTSDRPGDCPICNMKLVKKEMPAPHTGHDMTAEEVCLEHNCTMPQCQMTVRTDLKPGEKIICPVCGEYITTETGRLVKAEGEKKSPAVAISPEKQQLIGVKTVPVREMDLRKKIRTYGKIAYDPELVVAQEEFIQALTNEEKMKDSPLKDAAGRAESLTAAARKKLTLLGMSEEEIKQLETTRTPDRSLYLPEGEKVWAYLSVYEYEIALVKTGQLVEIEAPAYPGEKFIGKVSSINPVLDPATRTNQVRVEVDNPGGKLKPEMSVDGIITVDLGKRLSVPDSAILDTGVRKIVFLSKEGGLFESRKVETGQKADGYYEVINGLHEGDIVVTSGNFLIDAESKLKSASGGEHKH